jgi:VCBS repeat protein/FG-GAP repeat protein
MKSPLRYAFIVASAALLFPFSAALAQLDFLPPVNYSPGAIDLDTGLPAAPSDTTNIAPLNNPVSIAVGDFDGDGNLDLAVINGVQVQVKVLDQFKFYLSVFFGNGDGTFADPQIREIGGDCPVSTTKNIAACDRGVFIVAGKFNGLISAETHDDLAIVYFGNPTGTGGLPATKGKVGIFLSNGTQSNTFADPIFNEVGKGAISAAVGDFDNDDHLDIAVANREDNTVSVLFGNGLGGFSAATTPTVGKKPVAIAVGDFDGDTHLDLAAVNSVDNDVTILLYDAAHPRTFKAAPNCTASKATCQVGFQPFGAAAGDFDGDGVLDLAVFDQQNKSVTILIGNGVNGLGSFTASPKKKISLGKVAVQMVADDFNGDGTPDLAFAFFPKHNVTVFSGIGDGGFIVPGKIFNSTGTTGGAKPKKSLGNFAIASGKFNADGLADLAVANGDISVFLNNTPDPSGVTVTVDSPNGGETLTIGTTPAVITWHTILVPPTFPFGNVRIDLLTDPAVGFKTIVKSAPNTGTFSLKVPNSPTTTGRIRVCSVNYPGLCDESDADFTISP